MPRQTPLYPLHVELGAKIVDFAGWLMPLHYGSQLHEHREARARAGMFDVSHMRVIEIEGPDALRFLRDALANDVAKLRTPGRALCSCMLDTDGGILDDLIVYFVREGLYRVVVNAATAEKDIAWLHDFVDEGSFDVSIATPQDLCIVAVQGPQARERVWSALPGSAEATAQLRPFEAAWHGAAMIARTGYTGEDGFEIVLPAAEALPLWRALHGLGVQPCGLGARDTLRLEAGMHLYGQDMDEGVTPHECGLAWTLDVTPDRDFCGKAALARREPRWQMLGLVLMDKGILRSHQAIETASGEGLVTSGGYGPTLERSIGFARVPPAARIGDAVKVAVRDRRLEAVLTRARFVRNGKALVSA